MDGEEIGFIVFVSTILLAVILGSILIGYYIKTDSETELKLKEMELKYNTNIILEDE